VGLGAASQQPRCCPASHLGLSLELGDVGAREPHQFMETLMANKVAKIIQKRKIPKTALFVLASAVMR
jgi:hypothetical protein